MTKKVTMKDHVGIPVDRRTKDRLRRIADAKQRTHTETARLLLIDAIEREEKELGIDGELATSSK